MKMRHLLYHKVGYIGLILAGIGASIPFGISDSTQDSNLTPFEEIATVMFIGSTLILFVTAFIKDFHKWREEALLITGGLWFAVGTVTLLDLSDNNLTLTQVALSLTAYGLGVLAFDLWHRTRHESK